MFSDDSRKVKKVPDMELLPYKFIFQPISDDKVEEIFSISHKISESLYAGKGMWVESAVNPYPPMIRQTSRRVIGYLGAYGKIGKGIYRQRASEGLEYLLQQQQDSGEFVWYRNSVPGVLNENDGLYEAGTAGVALLEGYEEFNDKSCFAASLKAAHWVLNCPVSPNYNYNMFAVWLLSSHYNLTRDLKFLEGALTKVQTTVQDQLPNGRWEGHNSWIWYHGIILLGLAELYNALPASHTNKNRILSCIIKSVNRLIIDQQKDGSISPNPDESEYIYRKPDTNIHRNAFTLQALCAVRKYTGLCVTNIIDGLMQYRYVTETGCLSAYESPGFPLVKGSWKDRCVRSGKIAPVNEQDLSLPDEKIIWKDDFSKLVPDYRWGQIPEGWFICWYPAREPKPGCVRIEYDKTEVVLKYTIRNWGFNGLGLDLTKRGIILETGHRYRVCSKMKISADPSIRNRLLSLCLTAYSGEPRSKWDMITNCDFAVCNPYTYDFFDFVLWFVAKGDTNYIYFSADVCGPENGAEITFFINNIHITDEGLVPDTRQNEPLYTDYDCSIMALGEYIKYFL